MGTAYHGWDLLEFQDRDALWIPEPEYSMCPVLQVQFRTGLTEALLTMIVVRTFRQHPFL